VGLSYSIFSFSSDGGGASTSGFYLNVGSSGNTTFTFESPQPAGVYFISSKLEDPDYDIYLISESSTAAGYTNGEILIATEAFKQIVVYGSTPNDVLILESKPTVNTLTSGDINGGAAAYLLSVTPLDLASTNDTATLTGGNLATNVEIYFVDVNGVETPAKNIVRNSSTELIITRPDGLDPNNAPFDLKAISPGIPLPTTQPTAHILADIITVGTYPEWVTVGPIFWEKEDGMTQLAIIASDVENTDVDYQIISGSLFPGFSLDPETGIITGDDTALNTGDLCQFTVRATDTAGLVSTDRNFSLYVNAVPIHSFFFEAFVDAGRQETAFLFEHTIV
jgi:hypothetical protein